MPILSKTCKPDNFKLYNSVKLSFTNIRGLRSNFVGCESFLESNSPDILALCETNLDDPIDSGNFPVRGLSCFNAKRFYYSYASSCSLCERRTSFCTGLISWKRCRFSLMFSTGFTTQWLTFSSIDYLLCLYASFFILFDLTDEVLSINPSAHVFVFGDFNVHHKDWLTYSGGTDRTGGLCHNFSILDDLTQTDSHGPALLDLVLLTLAFVLQWLSFHWEILMLLSQFPLTSHQILHGISRFIA